MNNTQKRHDLTDQPVTNTPADERGGDSQPPSRPTRRGLLRKALAATAATGAAATGGCLGLVPPLGDRVQFGRVDVPPADPPAYRTWVPAAESFPDGSHLQRTAESAAVMVARPGELAGDAVDRPFGFPTQVMTARLDWLGTAFEHYDRAISIGAGIVLTGGPGRAAVADALDGTGYEPAGSYRGYDLYEREDLRRTVAAGAGAVLWVRDEQSTEFATAVIDARQGRRPRSHESDGDTARITAETGDRPWVWIGPDDTDPSGDALVGSTSLAFGSAAVFFEYRLLYPSADDVPKRALRRSLRNDDRALQSEAVDLSFEDRLAVIQQRHNAGRLDWEDGSLPQVTWGIEDADGTVTIHHEAGDPVDGDPLSVEFLPEETTVTVDADVLTPGDAVTVDRSVAPAASTLVLLYDQSWLFSYQLP